MSDSKKLLELINEDVIIDIMKENGSDLYSITTDQRTQQKCLWFQTICHGGDSHKLCFFCGTKDFYCYTNCGKMSFFEGIKRIRNARDSDFYEKVFLYIAKKVGYKTNKNLEENRIGIFERNKNNQYREEISRIESFLEKENRISEDYIEKIYDSKILNYFDNNTFYQGWIDEGIKIETMKKYQISWYEFQKHIIIPHFNINGELVGIRRRSLKPEDIKNKYMPEYLEGILYEHPLGLNLYGLNFNKEKIKKIKTVIIVEAEKSVLLSDSYFGKDSYTVATCGFNISDYQINLLYDLGVERIYIGFDKDFDLRKENIYKRDDVVYKKFLFYKERLYTLGKRISKIFDTYLIIDKNEILDIKDSPFDKGKNNFLRLLSKAERVN